MHTLSTPRRIATGWIGLAQALTQAPRRRRPDFAQTEPLVFRSECFAEDLAGLVGPAPRLSRRGLARNK